MPYKTTGASRKRKAPAKPAVVCAPCGKTGHKRSSSKKCANYRGNDKGAEGQDEEARDNERDDKCAEGQDEEARDNENGVDTTSSTSISYPNFVELKNRKNRTYEPVVDVDSRTFKSQETVFRVSGRDYRDRDVEIEASPENLMEKYFPDMLVERIKFSSNKYIRKRREENPDLYCWKSEKVSGDLTRTCVWHFIAILYYFGLVALPSKRDYWSSKEWMPKHPIVSQFGLTRDRFNFIWRNFHIAESDDTEGDEVEDNDDEEEDLVDIGFERIQREQEQQEGEDDDGSEEDDGNESSNVSETSTKKTVWYEKVQFLIDHVRDVSLSLIYVLGTIMSLDEMMIRFFGRSGETHRMKNKPIKEGYKFFVLATRSGFIINFTPDGRKAAVIGAQEYEHDRSLGKVESMILHVISVIDKLKNRQLTRLQKCSRSTRANGEDLFSERMMSTFVIAMDNYFTLPKVISKLREKGIGVVGTARYRGQTWPPKKLKEVSKDDASFNDFYWMVDEFGTLLGRWMDNGMVFVVSTIHRVGKIVQRRRKRPRKTQNNKSHVNFIWGENGTALIHIPTLIDNYNYWMGGVDVGDQRISYYHPSNIVCQRTWVPIFIQILSIIRNNAYVVHRTNLGPKALSHKDFTYQMISWLLKKAEMAQTSRRQLIIAQTANPHPSLVILTETQLPIEISNWLTSKFPNRFSTPTEYHYPKTRTRGSCIYCSALYQWRSNQGEYVNFHKEVKRTRTYCACCSSSTSRICFLCKTHYELFHESK